MIRQVLSSLPIHILQIKPPTTIMFVATMNLE